MEIIVIEQIIPLQKLLEEIVKGTDFMVRTQIDNALWIDPRPFNRIQIQIREEF